MIALEFHHALAALTVFLLLLVAGEGMSPNVLVYSRDMPGFVEEIAAELGNIMEGYEFVAVTDPSLMSSLLAMPDTACVVLVVMKGIEIEQFIDPLKTYFAEGGAAIGFQGCLGVKTAGDIARVVFPVFGNGTGSFKVKGDSVVNEYVRDEALEGFEDLPEAFDLLGQFFVYSQNASRAPIDPEVRDGRRTILYRDRQTSAPLVIAYENAAGSRSIAFTGMFVREVESARNYYGKLLEDPLFLSLLTDSLAWTVDGRTRFSLYQDNYLELIQQEADREAELRESADKAGADRARRRLMILGVSWAFGLAAVATLVYVGFLRKGGE